MGAFWRSARSSSCGNAFPLTSGSVGSNPTGTGGLIVTVPPFEGEVRTRPHRKWNAFQADPDTDRLDTEVFRDKIVLSRADPGPPVAASENVFYFGRVARPRPE